MPCSVPQETGELERGSQRVGPAVDLVAPSDPLSFLAF